MSTNANPASGEEAGLGNVVCSAAIDSPENNQPLVKTQAENTPHLSCAEMRVATIRGCLSRCVLESIAIALQAIAALGDEDDELALVHLRRQWRLHRAHIDSLAVELTGLLEQGAGR